MRGLFSDNAKAHTGLAVKYILHQCNIDDMQSEPQQQNQNPAERYIQEDHVCFGWLAHITVVFVYTPK
eukprot:790949-Ditylum_brightwellii.AAC.1